MTEPQPKIFALWVLDKYNKNQYLLSRHFIDRLKGNDDEDLGEGLPSYPCHYNLE